MAHEDYRVKDAPVKTLLLLLRPNRLFSLSTNAAHKQELLESVTETATTLFDPTPGLPVLGTEQQRAPNAMLKLNIDTLPSIKAGLVSTLTWWGRRVLQMPGQHRQAPPAPRHGPRLCDLIIRPTVRRCHFLFLFSFLQISADLVFTPSTFSHSPPFSLFSGHRIQCRGALHLCRIFFHLIILPTRYRWWNSYEHGYTDRNASEWCRGSGWR